jgi:hypothetical protein
MLLSKHWSGYVVEIGGLELVIFILCQTATNLDLLTLSMDLPDAAVGPIVVLSRHIVTHLGL